MTQNACNDSGSQTIKNKEAEYLLDAILNPSNGNAYFFTRFDYSKSSKYKYLKMNTLKNTLILFLIFNFCISQSIPLNYKLYTNEVLTKKGLLILFPGLGEDIHQPTKEQIELYNRLNNNCIAILILEVNKSFFLTNEQKLEISKIITEVSKELKINQDQIYCGGFSIGGNLSLDYAKFTLKNNIDYSPRKLVLIDPPIDLYRLFKNTDKYLTENDCANNSNFMLCEEFDLLNRLLKFFIGNEIEDYLKKTIYIENQINDEFDFSKNFDMLFFTDKKEKNYNKVNFKYSNYHSIISYVNYIKRISSKKIVIIDEVLIYDYENYQPHSWAIFKVEDFLKFIND